MNLLPLSEIIELAKERGVYLGKGTPQNRIAYFVKLGLIPHAVRKTNPKTGHIEAHFPISILETIEEINHLRRKNYSPYQIRSSIVSPLAQDLPSHSQSNEPQIKHHLNLKFLVAGFAVFLIAVLYTNFILTLAQPHSKVLGVETFIAPVIAEEGPIGSLISKAGNIFSAIGRSAFGGKGGSFVIPLLGKSELAVSDNLNVKGKARIAKDIEGLGNLRIKGEATVGRLITGIVDPYLIENDGTVQGTLEIRTTSTPLGGG